MRKLRSTVIVAFLAIFLPLTCLAWKGKVVGVADGDTITVLHSGHGEKIRLFGVDCPEKRQAFGKRAKQFTSSLVYGKVVKVNPVARDRYGRTVALVSISGTLLNEELVKNGFAWVYSRYCHRSFCKKWHQLEEKARDLRIGLWADPYAIAPWKYRHSVRTGHHGLTLSMNASTSKRKNSKSDTHMVYRGNIKSMVFHRPGCRYYNCSDCTVEFHSREEALAAGFTPCRKCSP